jgi:SAM-dependent methyltransferase
MSDYLQKNTNYWDKGYYAPHTENFIFRTYARILKPEFGLSGDQQENVLDFGCGEGANLCFFANKGFNVYGVDISKEAISNCKVLMPDQASHFKVIPAKPEVGQNYFEQQMDLIIAVQSLYYLSDSDLTVCLENLYRQLKPGGLFYATMMGTRCYYYKYTQPYEQGLRTLRFPPNHRLQVTDYFLRFVDSESDLLRIFNMFDKKHLGYYDAQIREDEGSEFHYTFLGQKPLSERS